MALLFWAEILNRQFWCWTETSHNELPSLALVRHASKQVRSASFYYYNCFATSLVLASLKYVHSFWLVRGWCDDSQALAWLRRNYWEEQEQLLPDTQGTLKTKLIEHAQVIYEILVSQQKLLGKEVKGQDYKQQRLTLKRALKGKSECENQTHFGLSVSVGMLFGKACGWLIKSVVKGLHCSIHSWEINAFFVPRDTRTGGQSVD